MPAIKRNRRGLDDHGDARHHAWNGTVRLSDTWSDNVNDLDFEQALWLVLRARELGARRELNVTVAVHDAAGHPVLVARGSDRWHGPYMAMGKARLAAA